MQRWLSQPHHLASVLLSLLPIFLVYVYIDTYSINAPVNDQWLDSLDIAVATQDGTLTLDDITRVYYGHRAVFTNGFTAFLAYTTNWQVGLELALSFGLAIGRLMLAVLIFRAVCPQMTYMVLLPFSLLIFSMLHYLIWLSGIYSVWHFVSFFSLAAVLVLTQFGVGWHTLSLAAVFAVCASFSQGSGIVTFPILALTLWMFGYRHWKYYGFWLGVAALTLFVYFYNSEIGVGGETSETSATINLRDPFKLIEFVLAFLGNPFTYNLNTETPTYIGGIGVGLLILNMVYLWRTQKNLKRIAPFMTMAGYASSIAVIVYMTRYREDRFIYTIEQRYALVSTTLWLAVIGTGVLVWWQAHQQKKKTRWEDMLPPANLMVATLLLVFYLLANIWNLQATAFRYQYVLGEKFPPHETCLLDFPLKRDFACVRGSVPLGEASEDDIYRMAYYELGVFDGRQQRITLLPENYREGSPIILDTPARWMNAYLRRWYLAEIDEDVLFHVAPEAVEVSTDTLSPPLEPLVTGYDEATSDLLAAFIGDNNTVWYVRTRETQANEAAVYEVLTRLGYLPTVIPSTDYRFNNELFIVRYESAPQTLEEIQLFGEVISLQNVTLPETDVAACETVQVLSWWTVTTPPDANAVYGLHLALMDENMQVIVENASGLTPVPSVFWSVGQFYLDDRSLTLPCDLSEGIYQLQLSIENAGQQLPETVTLAEFQIGE